jgi:DNA-binding transcriptional regulator YiaG
MPVAELDRALLSLRSGRCARLRALPFCQLQTKAVYSGKSGYWESVHNYRRLPHSLGEHVRKRRLDLGLGQREAAAQMGVHVETLKFWERGVLKPAIGIMPKVIEFLGTNPRPKPTTFAELLLGYRACHGLCQVELSARLGVNPSTLGRWESGQTPPPARMQKIEAILATMR